MSVTNCRELSLRRVLAMQTMLTHSVPEKNENIQFLLFQMCHFAACNCLFKHFCTFHSCDGAILLWGRMSGTGGTVV